jgi:hypothetical protein
MQKRAWVRQHLSESITILPMMGGVNKAMFMHEPGDILIDDMAKNCNAWEEVGGIAIVHQNADATRAQLEQIVG